jgi:translation initiation factor IF-2
MSKLRNPPESDKSSENQLRPRPPVVTVMGHVDHGKTLLLDAIRKTHVADREVRGMTQDIGAYIVPIKGSQIVFIDTPGHEAFTFLRTKGVQVTDIILLVVAADEGVMAQTIEAINHAKAAEVPIVVAINKIDKPQVQPEKIMRDLAELGLVPEQWGGDTLFTQVSAKTHKGINDLLESILLQADLMELKATPEKKAKGIIMEVQMQTGLGPVASVIVQEGTLKVGDSFVAGKAYGKVKSIMDSEGRRVRAVTPSLPAGVTGFSELPRAGDSIVVVQDEKTAKKITNQIIGEEVRKELPSKPGIKQVEEVPRLKLILKAHTQGMLEALSNAIRKLSSDRVKVDIIHGGIGEITQSDVYLASASRAIIIGFRVKPEPMARSIAHYEGIDLNTYSVIYDVIAEVRDFMADLLPLIQREKVLGRGEVIKLFRVRKIGTIAGTHVQEGWVRQGSHVRVIRENQVIHEGILASLRHYEESMRECTTGYDCGIKVKDFEDFELGDVIESYELEKVKSED